MKWLTIFLQLLPTIVTSVEQVGSHLAGHEKKAAVQDALTGIAAGVGSILPQHATAAADAAAAASAGIDGVVQVLNDVGALNPHKTATVPAATQAVAVAAAAVASVATAVAAAKPEPSPIVYGPGLDKVVPA